MPSPRLANLIDLANSVRPGEPKSVTIPIRDTINLKAARAEAKSLVTGFYAFVRRDRKADDFAREVQGKMPRLQTELEAVQPSIYPREGYVEIFLRHAVDYDEMFSTDVGARFHEIREGGG